MSREATAAAVEVHKTIGAGLLESIYEKCYLRELELRGIHAASQKRVRIEYKGLVFEETLKYGVLVEQCLLVELVGVPQILPLHQVQLLSYMRFLNTPVGLLVNFHEEKLAAGVVRMMLPGVNKAS